MPKLTACFFVIVLTMSAASVSIAGGDPFAITAPPTKYIHSKLSNHDIVFLGTKHRQPRILNFIAELIPSLKELGVTHIGLEISSDQQGNIDTYMETGEGLSEIQIVPQIDCPEYRNLFTVLRDSGGPRPVAIDLSKSEYKGDISRDEWMSMSLLKVLRGTPSAKILVVVGNLHTLKTLDWEERLGDKDLSIRQYILRGKPSTKMWSVAQVINEKPAQCDFFQRYGPLPGAVALDVDGRYRGWKLGFTDIIAIVPAQCFELVDGVIVY